MRIHHASALNDYITRTFVRETALLEEVRAKGEALVAGMQISPLEGKLLYMLARMIQAQHILEIGTFVGYSTLWLAAALPAHGTLCTIEAKSAHAALAREHIARSELAEKIDLREGKAFELLATMKAEPHYDMVFIDAAKNEYLEYMHLSEPMLRVGGVMVLDNSLLFGHMYGEPSKRASAAAIKAVRACNDRLGDSRYYDGLLLPTEEGLTVGIKL
jgi:predicted O-methyltransferase YrrM